MSLYTLSSLQPFQSRKKPAGLRIEKSRDIHLLSFLGNISVDEVCNRFANDHITFVAFMNDQPAAFGWMARSTARIGELNHEFILPEQNRYLWNFRTLEAYRGLGIYPALLQYILQNEKEKANRFWIIHAPENNASLKGIKKAGFQFVGKLYINRNEQVMIEENAVSLSHRKLLKHMNIELSEQSSASCWNCSSPYLKKRKARCCCNENVNECIGNNLHALAYL